ncbi:MAG: hypothetical protein QG670_960 [Thermoproteota archaeon]|nr:hypothetical protein [Thermoproteota archaeon]
MKNLGLIIIAILGILAISIVVFLPALYGPFNRGFFNGGIPPEPPPWDALFPYLFIAKIILSSANFILLTIVLVIYIGIYQKTKSQFSLGLVIFTIALLLYSFTSNPIMQGFGGFRVSGLGPFIMLPDLFSCIASVILLYLSRQ